MAAGAVQTEGMAAMGMGVMEVTVLAWISQAYLWVTSLSGTLKQGCQMAKFDPFLSLDCTKVEGRGVQSTDYLLARPDKLINLLL